MSSSGEISRQAGVQSSKIRYYENIGLVPRAKRVHGHRRFDSMVLGWLSLIDLAQRAGFSLAEVRLLFQGFDPGVTPSERWLEMKKLPEIDALITRARGMKQLLETGLRCGCLRLEDCARVLGGRPNGAPAVS